MAEDKVGYEDAMKTHGFKGTAIPGAKGTGEVADKALSKGDLGVQFDPQAPYPQNIIIADKDGERIVAKMDVNAINALKAANKTSAGGHVSYEEALAMSKHGEYGAAVTRPEEPAKKGRGRKAAASPSLLAPQQSPVRPASLDSVALADLRPNQTRTKVKFVGQFGSVTAPYDSVHREDIYLIMTQVSDDGEFFEAPQGEQPIEVHLGMEKLLCYSGPQFRLLRDGRVFVTIYMVDEAATREGRDA